MTFTFARLGKLTLLLSAALLCVHCQPKSDRHESIEVRPSAALAPLNSNQRAMDFDFMVEGLRAYYAPLKFKQDKFGFDFESLAQTARAKIKEAKTDEEAAGLMFNFISNFHDSHLSLSLTNSESEIQGYDLGFQVLNFGERAVIVNPGPEAAKFVKDGDELVSVDGLTPSAFLQKLKTYRALGTDSADRTSLMYFAFRPVFFTQLVPTSKSATVQVLRSNAKATFLMKWEKVARKTKRLKDSLNKVLEVESLYEDQLVPRMISEATLSQFGVKEVEADEAMLEANVVRRADVLVKDHPLFRAYLYEWKGQRILLIRCPSFSAEDEYWIVAEAQLRYLKALLDTHYANADRFIIDLQGNTGGSTDLASKFVSYFSDHSLASETRLLNADRAWSLKFLNQASDPSFPTELKQLWVSASLEIDRAMEAGQRLTSPLRIKPPSYPSRYEFRKPLLALIDGGSVSAAEIAAMYIQDHKLGTIMGVQTSGGGGNVEMILTLPYSQAKLNVTRSLSLRIGSESKPRFIENEGVRPDIPYEPTVEDYRKGFVEMFAAVSDAALSLGE